jgi:hypothetical protein
VANAAAHDVEDGGAGDYQEQKRGADEEEEGGWSGAHLRWVILLVAAALIVSVFRL